MFDDFRILEPEVCGDSAFRFFKVLGDLFGIRFDDSKDNIPAPILELLGNLEDFTKTSVEDAVYVAARPQRLADIEQEVAIIFSQRRIAPGSAASLRGKLLHLAQTRPGRLSRATLVGLNKAANAQHLIPWSDRL